MDILPGPSGQSFLGEPSGSLDSGQGKILHFKFGRWKTGRQGPGGVQFVNGGLSGWVGRSWDRKSVHQIFSSSSSSELIYYQWKTLFLDSGVQKPDCCMLHAIS